MAKKLSLIRADDVPQQGGVEVVAEGRIFAVFRIGDEFYVIDGVCAHAGGPLAKGTLDGCVVTCPWHGWQYDVTTGQHLLTPTICQQHFPAEVVDGMVCIELDE